MATTHHFRIDKAKRDFGWEPKVSMDEVWSRCLAYCRELLDRRQAGSKSATTRGPLG